MGATGTFSLKPLGLDGIVEQKLRSFAPLEMVVRLEQRIESLEKENLQLRNKVIEFNREVYTVHDLAKELVCDVATVRKNYIKTDKIKAEKTAAGWEVSKKEFFRVVEIIKTRGKHYL